ncbi:MAG: DUF6159 family protein [Candidatus Brocadiia bacterium]
MFSRIGQTFDLMKMSWQVLKKDKEMLFFPLLSAISCLIVLASFFVPLNATGNLAPPGEGASSVQEIIYWAIVFLFYFCNYFVIIFFNSGLIACAIIRFRGGNPTVMDGIRASLARLHCIIGWALLAATVGLVLRMLESRFEKAGRIISSILGTAWTIMTYLAVPVLVIEKTGPIETFKRSTGLLKDTWGSQLVGEFGFGLLFFMLSLPAAVFVFLGFLGGTALTLSAGIAVAVLYMIIIGLVQSALQGIFQAALYLYAADQEAPEGFDTSSLSNAIHER